MSETHRGPCGWCVSRTLRAIRHCPSVIAYLAITGIVSPDLPPDLRVSIPLFNQRPPTLFLFKSIEGHPNLSMLAGPRFEFSIKTCFLRARQGQRITRYDAQYDALEYQKWSELNKNIRLSPYSPPTSFALSSFPSFLAQPRFPRPLRRLDSTVDFVSFSTVVWPKKSPLGCPATRPKSRPVPRPLSPNRTPPLEMPPCELDE